MSPVPASESHAGPAEGDAPLLPRSATSSSVHRQAAISLGLTPENNTRLMARPDHGDSHAILFRSSRIVSGLGRDVTFSLLGCIPFFISSTADGFLTAHIALE